MLRRVRTGRKARKRRDRSRARKVRGERAPQAVPRDAKPAAATSRSAAYTRPLKSPTHRKTKDQNGRLTPSGVVSEWPGKKKDDGKGKK